MNRFAEVHRLIAIRRAALKQPMELRPPLGLEVTVRELTALPTDFEQVDADIVEVA